jgi:hypothetical protein
MLSLSSLSLLFSVRLRRIWSIISKSNDIEHINVNNVAICSLVETFFIYLFFIIIIIIIILVILIR